jgi:putative nucleotidyltransferase with HDIG domain
MTTKREWRARPVARRVVKAAALLVPVLAGTGAGLVVARTVPVPEATVHRVGWSILVLGTSTIVLLLVERLARRLGPLALLLQLSLAFPDQAPSRFGIALKASRPGRRADAGAPVAAHDSLVLLASLLAHDRRTRGHCERVAAYARMVGEELGLEGRELDELTWAALLHDIGKLKVPARILNKPGPLDAEEWRIMAGHPEFGAELVRPLRPWLGDALSAVDGHHERFDGTGYPLRRPSAELPIAARVVALADAFEVMTAARSYKEPMSIGAARQEVAASAGGHFDPKVARAFLDLSVPKLWRVAGPMAWLAQVPVVGLLARGDVVPVAVSSAAQGAAAATGQAVMGAAVVGGALMTVGATAPISAADTGPPAVVAEPDRPAAPSTTTTTTVVPPSSTTPPGSGPVAGTGPVDGAVGTGGRIATDVVAPVAAAVDGVVDGVVGSVGGGVVDDVVPPVTDAVDGVVDTVLGVGRPGGGGAGPADVGGDGLGGLGIVGG